MSATIDHEQWNVSDPECRMASEGATPLELRLLLVPEEEGGYSAHALHLPGVVSQGETVEEAIENIRDAFHGAVTCYHESGNTIPWSQEVVMTERPAGAIERWIVVDV